MPYERLEKDNAGVTTTDSVKVKKFLTSFAYCVKYAISTKLRILNSGLNTDE